MYRLMVGLGVMPIAVKQRDVDAPAEVVVVEGYVVGFVKQI